MKFERSAGILLHPTSLPGKFGIGDLGPEAYRWIEFLAKSGCVFWQILPLGPTGYGDSPYQSFSAFAGNPYLISPELLLEDHLIKKEDLDGAPKFPAYYVDYGEVMEWKKLLLIQAHANFLINRDQETQDKYDEFLEHSPWLRDYSLYMALKEAHDGEPWMSWEPGLRTRDSNTMFNTQRQYANRVDYYCFCQFLFYKQWGTLRDYARQNKIKIIGDIPIFVAADSADVWAQPELFFLDQYGNPSIVAGVPPDYFSPTGQLWGNPLYRWETHREDGYTWWIERVKNLLQIVDIIRLDHFRGFLRYWAVAGSAKTAERGRWMKGPASDFFRSIQNALGNLPFIAEDLGVITPDVIHLRERFKLPGMKVLQFAFLSNPDDQFLPHNFPTHCIVYTGTHDNDTVKGWYERVPEEERDFYRHYMNRNGDHVAWDFIRACWSSVAVVAIAPMQDFLDLGNEARMNLPGQAQGNWQWRMPEDACSHELIEQIREINYLYSRLNKL